VISVRSASVADRVWIADFLARVGAVRVARRDELVAPLDHDHLIAELDDRRAGLLTYIVTGETCEILTIHAEPRLAGVGSALVEAVRRVARERGCRSLWVLTTNDNIEGLRFYQRRGFALCSLRPGAVDRSRRNLKPEIPSIGDHGIPIRDELELSMSLDAPDQPMTDREETP
jgi:N-acetylglutamate synthase-like GNAT family acetyltransferase